MNIFRLVLSERKRDFYVNKNGTKNKITNQVSSGQIVKGQYVLKQWALGLTQKLKTVSTKLLNQHIKKGFFL